MKELLVMIPAYNEEQNIEAVVESVRADAPFADILVVDDGSRDGTSGVCRRLRVPVARHKVNLGLASAVRTGMKYALDNDYSYILQFDGDGQHDSKAIKEMLRTATDTGSDITIGSRYVAGNSGSVLKTIGRNLILFCIRITTGTKVTDPTSGMRMYDRRVMKLFMNSIHYSPEPDTLAYVIRRGMKVSEIPVIMRERQHGTSYLDLVESIRYMFRMCTSILLVQWFR